MITDKTTIISALRSQILRLEGFRSNYTETMQTHVDPIRRAFPGCIFPVGCIHEFVWSDIENFSATGAFISSLIPSWIKTGGVIVWISNDQKVMPSSLPAFGVTPHHVLFVQAQEKDILWVTEEVLKCKAVTAVVSEVRDFNFTASRRLQLAVAGTKTTGFVVRCVRGKLSTTACVSRWRITHLPSEAIDNIPGVGYPCWSVELLRVRNGKPASWQLEWNEGRFEYIQPLKPDRIDPAFHQHANVG